MDEEPEAPETDEEDAPRPQRRTRREAELATRRSVRDAVLKVFQGVDKGFQDEAERTNEQLENWDLYNNRLGLKQTYNGNAQIFVPLIEGAVDARVTRFVNQMFPTSGRNVEVMSADGKFPSAIMSLLEAYVRKARLKTDIIPPMLVNGDAEGQWSLYMKWTSLTRHTVRKEQRPVTVPLSHDDDIELPGEEHETMVEEEVIDAFPDCEVISDADLCILPATATSVADAIERGGSVTVRRHWTKGDVLAMVEDGEIMRQAGEELAETMTRMQRQGRKEIEKQSASAAGIKIGSGGSKTCDVFETWTRIKVDGQLRTVRCYYAGSNRLLSVKLNPYWCDRVPVVTCAVKKKAGLIKGRPPISSVADLQVYANDMINEAADTAHFSAMPIVMSNPEKNPGPMILGLAAIWRADPNNTKILEFPPLWRYGFEIVAKCQEAIFQRLSVNPAMIPQSTGGPGKKRNQAEIASEQQVDLLTTADVVGRVEEGILNEVLEWFVELDHQFRDKEITVRAYGEMGLRAEMERVPLVQMGARYVYSWNGVQAARNAAQAQQQIAGLNVLKQVPPQSIPGFKINLAPIISSLVLSTYGSRMAPLILEDLSKTQALDPELENDMLEEGFDVAVNPQDDDPKHLKAHVQGLQESGDPHGTFRAHIAKHQMQMQAKAAQQAMQMMQQQGGPQGAGRGPQAGAQPQGQRPMRGPPGMIAPESMPAAGAPGAPRKT